MKRIVLAATALAVLGQPLTAEAKTVKCKVGYYSPGADESFPTPSNLKAVDLPKLTDGYAPPCLVAESVASSIQFDFGENGSLPDSVKVYGARWYGGKWICTYREVWPEGYDNPWQEARCHKSGKSTRKVTMRLDGE